GTSHQIQKSSTGKRNEALPARLCNGRLAVLGRALREPCRHNHSSRSLVRSAVASEVGVTTMAFMDMREWMSLLEKAGELRRVTAEVDWDREIGAVARRVLEKKGPALLFENIKGYGSGRCTQLLSGLGARSRLALALGFQREVANRELVQ